MLKSEMKMGHLVRYFDKSFITMNVSPEALVNKKFDNILFFFAIVCICLLS